MEFLAVRNFRRYQHYKDRRPPWIKLYHDLWGDEDFFKLSVSERYYLIAFFVVASQNENCIPNNQEWLRREMAVKKPVPVERLKDAGWLYVANEPLINMPVTDADASTVLAQRREREEKEQERRIREERERERARHPEILELGEFRRVQVTREQYSRLTDELGSSLGYYIDRMDRWLDRQADSESGKLPQRLQRKAYSLIRDWFSEDQRNGTRSRNSASGEGTPDQTHGRGRNGAGRYPEYKPKQ